MIGVTQDATTLDDPKRLGVLRSYEILDTPPELAFDRLAKLAAQICGAPYAASAFLDGSRQFIKSKVGFTYADAPDQPVFCCQAVHQSGLFIVPDATHDERFATDPLVTGVAQVRFYAGMPLVTMEGHALGMLCVLDRIPRQLSKEFAVFYCADVDEDGVPYYESIALADCYHPQTIMAYELNGAPLDISHGVPIRLRFERQLGYKHAKYVTKIELVETLSGIAGGKDGYWEDDQGYEWYAGI